MYLPRCGLCCRVCVYSRRNRREAHSRRSIATCLKCLTRSNENGIPTSAPTHRFHVAESSSPPRRSAISAPTPLSMQGGTPPSQTAYRSVKHRSCERRLQFVRGKHGGLLFVGYGGARVRKRAPDLGGFRRARSILRSSTMRETPAGALVPATG